MAERTSLKRIQALVQIDPVAASAALEQHRNTFRQEFLQKDRERIEAAVAGANVKLRLHQERTPKP